MSAATVDLGCDCCPTLTEAVAANRSAEPEPAASVDGGPGAGLPAVRLCGVGAAGVAGVRRAAALQPPGQRDHRDAGGGARGAGAAAVRAEPALPSHGDGGGGRGGGGHRHGQGGRAGAGVGPAGAAGADGRAHRGRGEHDRLLATTCLVVLRSHTDTSIDASRWAVFAYITA